MPPSLNSLAALLREGRKPTGEAPTQVLIEAQVDEETAAWLAGLAEEIGVDRSMLAGAALTDGLGKLRRADGIETSFLDRATKAGTKVAASTGRQAARSAKAMKRQYAKRKLAKDKTSGDRAN